MSCQLRLYAGVKIPCEDDSFAIFTYLQERCSDVTPKCKSPAGRPGSEPPPAWPGLSGSAGLSRPLCAGAPSTPAGWLVGADTPSRQSSLAPARLAFPKAAT